MNLTTLWRARADELEPYAPTVAKAIRTCADELETASKADASELVSLAEAALLSGYDADSLGRMIRDGRLINYGKKARPRVRRSDLPRKPGHHEIDAAGIAVAARTKKPA